MTIDVQWGNGEQQYDIPDDVLALVRAPDILSQTYDLTARRYWTTKIGSLSVAVYKGAAPHLWFRCSAECEGSCGGPGTRDEQQLRQLFGDVDWRSRHGMEPAEAASPFDELWDAVRQAARRS